MWAVLMLGEMRSEQQLPVRECFLLGSVSSELGRHGAAQLEVDRAGRLSYLPPSGLICAAVSPPRPLRLRTKHFSRCREPAPGEEARTLFLGPNCERHRRAGNRDISRQSFIEIFLLQEQSLINTIIESTKPEPGSEKLCVQ